MTSKMIEISLKIKIKKCDLQGEKKIHKKILQTNDVHYSLFYKCTFLWKSLNRPLIMKLLLIIKHFLCETLLNKSRPVPEF